MSVQGTTQDAGKSLGQAYLEEVERLKLEGLTNAEALRRVAESHGKPVNAIRGGIYQYRVRAEGHGRSGVGRRQSAASVEDLVGQARASVEHALRLIDQEVADAKTQYETAKVGYEELESSAAERKADLNKKLKALS